MQQASAIICSTKEMAAAAIRTEKFENELKLQTLNKNLHAFLLYKNTIQPTQPNTNNTPNTTKAVTPIHLSSFKSTQNRKNSKPISLRAAPTAGTQHNFSFFFQNKTLQH